MRNLIILIAVLALLAGVGYVVFFRWGDANRAAKGYKKAETPQACAEMFRKAINDRDYDIAADYVTPTYAEQLKKVHTEARELGQAIDNLESQLNSRGLMRDEIARVLFALDPFPKIEVNTADESSGTPKIKITIPLPKVGQSQVGSGDWQLRKEVLFALVPTMPADRRVMVQNVLTLPMKKDGEVWKIDVPVDSGLQNAVSTLKDKSKNFVNPLNDVKDNVKIDSTTKENVAAELRRLLEQGSKE